jgi:hypothetical protein
MCQQDSIFVLLNGIGESPNQGNGSMATQFGAETILFSLERDRGDERLHLREAYLTGRPVRSGLFSGHRSVRVLDYSEGFRDGRLEIAVSVLWDN